MRRAAAIVLALSLATLAPSCGRRCTFYEDCTEDCRAQYEACLPRTGDPACAVAYDDCLDRCTGLPFRTVTGECP